MNTERDSRLNTERDNFYDWAKDKPDTTSYARLDHMQTARRSPGIPWGRIGTWVVVAVIVAAAVRYFLA